MQKILIENGLVMDPASAFAEVASVAIADGIIQHIRSSTISDFSADVKIDARNAVVCPGLVDLRANVFADSVTPRIASSEIRAAFAGGVCSVCVAPQATEGFDLPGLIANLCDRDLQVPHMPLHVLGNVLQNETQLGDYGSMKQAGALGIANGRTTIANTRLLRRAMQYAHSHNMKLFLHARDPWLSAGCAHEGPTATRLGLADVPAEAEWIELCRIIHLAQAADCALHCCGISSGPSVEIIQRAKRTGLDISCDVAIHHLWLCDEDISDYDVNVRTDPVLRSCEDRMALLQGVQDGSIDTICSDHSPHHFDYKNTPFSESRPGISGLETLLSLTMKLVAEKKLSLPQAIALITCKPSEVLGVAPSFGTLQQGKRADVCIFDPNPAAGESASAQLDIRHSFGQNSPFLGMPMNAQVLYTLSGGTLVHRADATHGAAG